MSNNIKIPDRRLVWSSFIGIVIETGYTLVLLGTAAAIALLVWWWAM